MAWEKARAGFLAKHRFCECPEHKGTPTAPLATVVHHDPPHKGDKSLFWNRATWHAWAKPCHDTHTGRYDRPESRNRVGAPASVVCQGCDGRGGSCAGCHGTGRFVRPPTGGHQNLSGHPHREPAVPVSRSGAGFSEGAAPTPWGIA